MSTLLLQPVQSHFDSLRATRKRVTSFSRACQVDLPSSWEQRELRPTKHRHSDSDTMAYGLKRTKSCVDINGLVPAAIQPPSLAEYTPRSANGVRAIIHVEEDREKIGSLIYPYWRTSSPLSPRPHILPPRASFPRSKNEPDLYKLAITTRMRSSPEGQQILRFGARAAVQYHEASLKHQDYMKLMTSQLWEATLELERIVQSQQRDLPPMRPFDTSNSWVVIPLEDSGWEMIDCAA